MNIIELKDISKSFSGRKVLNQINLSIKKGDIVGLIGRNGSGKTVLMKCICGFLTPEQGRIKLRGKNVDFQKNNIENIGIILETPGFLEQETALNNLWYLANLRNLIEKKEVENAIERVGLNPKEKKKVKKYSMGMRQRLGIAQAIMEKPDILLLDEPTNSLDEKGVETVRKLFLQLKKRMKTNFVYCLSFICSEREADKIRRFGQDFLKKSKVRYSSKRSYPESGYNTPAFEAPIDVWFSIAPPKAQEMRNTDLLRLCLDLVDEINRVFVTVQDMTIENSDYTSPDCIGIHL